MDATPGCCKWPWMFPSKKCSLMKNFLESCSSVSSKGAVRRIMIASDCVQHQEEEALKLNLWQPLHGKRTIRRRRLLYFDTLLK